MKLLLYEIKTRLMQLPVKAILSFLLITILVLVGTACNKGVSSGATTGTVMTEATTTRPPTTPTPSADALPCPYPDACSYTHPGADASTCAEIAHVRLDH